MKQLLKFIYCTLLLTVVFFESCKKDLDCNNCNENKPPIANAGPDETITLPVNFIILNGSASKNGSRSITAYLWAKISGPASLKMISANQSVNRVTDLEAGTYEFQLKVTDAAGFSSTDNIVITVLPASFSTPLQILSGTAKLTHIGLLTQAKTVMPATAADKLVFAGGYTNWANPEPTASVDIYNLSTNIWSTAQLSESRGDITVATVGNKILYAGGTGIRNYSSRVDIYDAVANTWSSANLSEGRSQMTTAIAGNKVFFAGGDYSGVTNKVDIYDANTNNWTTAFLSESRNGISVISAGNKVFFAGGYTKFHGFYESPYDFSTRVDIYDISTNSWSTTELKIARSGMATAIAGNKVLFAGGYYITDPGLGQETKSNVVDIYDLSTNAWSATTLNKARSGIVAAKVAGKVLFAGGGGNEVDIYDATTNSWTVTTLNENRDISSAVTLGNKALLFTGYPNYNRMDIYDALSNTWSVITLDKPIYSIPIVAGNVVFFGGGMLYPNIYQNTSYNNNVWKLEF